MMPESTTVTRLEGILLPGTTTYFDTRSALSASPLRSAEPGHQQAIYAIASGQGQGRKWTPYGSNTDVGGPGDIEYSSAPVRSENWSQSKRCERGRPGDPSRNHPASCAKNSWRP